MRVLPALLVTCLATSAFAVEAEVTLSHVGRLMDPSDTPIDGAQELTFRIYTTPAKLPGIEDVVVWHETYSATLTRGVYSLELGATDTGKAVLPYSVFTTGEGRWLSVAVGSTELSPRLRLGRAPIAQVAQKALDSDKLGGATLAEVRDATKLTGTLPASALGEGAATITTLGTIATGTWNATPIAEAKVASAEKWNAKLDAITSGAGLLGTGTAADPVKVAFGNTAGTVTAGNDGRFTQLTQDLATLSTSVDTRLGEYAKTSTLTDVARTGTANTFTQAQTFSGAATFAQPVALNGAVTLGAALDFKLQPLQNFRFPTASSAPACDPTRVGLAYFDTTAGVLRVCNGSSFLSVGATVLGTTDVTGGGTASADATYNGTYAPSVAVDNNDATCWGNNNVLPSWWQYDFGATGARRIGKVRILPNFNRQGSGWGGVGAFQLQASNDATSWTIIGSYTHGNNQNFEDFAVSSPSIAYRYWRIHVTSAYTDRWVSICELELYEFL